MLYLKHDILPKVLVLAFEIVEPEIYNTESFFAHFSIVASVLNVTQGDYSNE